MIADSMTRLEIAFDTFWHENYHDAKMEKELEQAIKAMLKRAYLSGVEYAIERTECVT